MLLVVTKVWYMIQSDIIDCWYWVCLKVSLSSHWCYIVQSGTNIKGRGKKVARHISPASSPTIQNRAGENNKTDSRTFVFSVCVVLVLVSTTVGSYSNICWRRAALFSLPNIFLWAKHIPCYRHNIKCAIKGFIIAVVWHGLLFCSQYRVMFVKNNPPALNSKLSVGK